ncbi:hypothetical protein bcgnr5411_14390 [Bacillus cereus]
MSVNKYKKKHPLLIKKDAFLLLLFVDFGHFQGDDHSIHTRFIYYLFFDSLRGLSTRIISVLVSAVVKLLDRI